MSRRLRRSTHKYVGSSGYQRFSGDIEVQGNIIGPSMALVSTAIEKLACGTTTPVKLTITRCEPGFNSVVVQWAIQYNLVNLDHYEVQVSSNTSDWYSLKFDGTDWKDTLNAHTDWSSSILVHTAPVIALYYRIRQVTVLGVTSAWSDATAVTFPSPAQLTITRCIGAYKSIVLQWQAQYNLLNLDHYEVQVSSDNSTWYSLRFTGTAAGEWKDTLNADTDWPDTVLVHIPIPFGGTADAPTAVTLYYRVRQVTYTGAIGTWSSSANATTSLIQTGDIVANGITANKILAGAITASKIATDAVEADKIKASAVTADKIAADAITTNKILAGAVTASKIDVTDLDVHKCTVTDSLDRYIEISAAKGLYAQDEDGNIIHDIPNAPILADMIYSGHLIWKEAPDYLASIVLTNTDTQTNRYGSSSVSNVNISAQVGGNTNVRGAVISMEPHWELSAAKVAIGTYASLVAKYCSRYNSKTGADWQFIGGLDGKSQVATQIFQATITLTRSVPVIWEGGVPYICWFVYRAFLNMAAASAEYHATAYLYLCGLYI